MTKRTRFLLGILATVVLLVGLAGWWFLIRDDAPAEANLADARATLGDDDGSSSTGDAVGSVDGAWAVDPTIGSFDDFSGSWAGYRIEEELATIGANTAVGRTPVADGELTIAGEELTSAEITVELGDLESDAGFRDSATRDALEVEEFPAAVFVTTEPVDLGGTPDDGTAVATEVDGELTLHGVSLPVVATIDAELADGVIIVTGSMDIDMTDFGITPPKRGAVLGISDEAIIEFQLFFTQS